MLDTGPPLAPSLWPASHRPSTSPIPCLISLSPLPIPLPTPPFNHSLHQSLFPLFLSPPPLSSPLSRSSSPPLPSLSPLPPLTLSRPPSLLRPPPSASALPITPSWAPEPPAPPRPSGTGGGKEAVANDLRGTGAEGAPCGLPALPGTEPPCSSRSYTSAGAKLVVMTRELRMRSGCLQQ